MVIPNNPTALTIPVPEAKLAPTLGAPSRNVFRAAERSIEFFDHLRVHYRESRRTEVRIETALKLKLKDGTIYDSGTATILNISPSGALLGEIRLARNAYPSEPFLVELVLKGGDYEGIGVEARPVRFSTEPSGLGVKFEEIFVTV